MPDIDVLGTVKTDDDAGVIVGLASEPVAEVDAPTSSDETAPQMISNSVQFLAGSVQIDADFRFVGLDDAVRFEAMRDGTIAQDESWYFKKVGGTRKYFASDAALKSYILVMLSSALVRLEKSTSERHSVTNGTDKVVEVVLENDFLAPPHVQWMLRSGSDYVPVAPQDGGIQIDAETGKYKMVARYAAALPAGLFQVQVTGMILADPIEDAATEEAEAVA